MKFHISATTPRARHVRSPVREKAATPPCVLAAKALQVRTPVDWDAQPLGTMPDRDMGKLHGVSTRSAKEARERRGIAAYCEQTD